jgi:CHAD domain-containing protein
MVAGTTTYRPTAPASDAATVLDVLGRAGLITEVPAQSTLALLDTFDGRIADAGLRLELVDGRQLVLRGDGVVDARIAVTAQPRTAEDVPAGPLRSRLARLLDVRALLRFVEVTSERIDAQLRNGAGKVTVTAAVHRSPAASGVGLDPVLVEVHELAGYPKPAAELRALIEGAGFGATDGGLAELAATSIGVPLEGFDVPVGVPLAAGDTAIDGFRRVLSNLRDAMVANWDGAVADIDPEFLHDLRVAVRRTRVVLGNAKRVLPEAVRQQAREDFAWIGSMSGTARDLDVYQIEWPDYTAALDRTATEALVPLREHLGVEREAAHADLAGQLTSARASEFVERWNEWLDNPVEPATLGDRSLEALPRTVRRRIRRAHGVMVDRGRSITPATPAETVHELRKDAKKLRYLIECFGGLFEKGPRAAFVGRLKSLQDTLGEHQDAEVHAHALRTIADDPRLRWSADTLLAIGQLIERLEQRRTASRGELAERFAEFDRKQTRAALKELLASAGQADR